MTCRNCIHTLKGPMTKHGFQACSLGARWEYFPGGHSCVRFVAVVRLSK